MSKPLKNTAQPTSAKEKFFAKLSGKLVELFPAPQPLAAVA
jgi:hypothetical protein